MTLHLVFSQQGLEDCLLRRHSKDPVVLLGDSTYALLQCDIECFVLSADATARGISDHGNNIRSIDYAGLVELTMAHIPVVSWAN